LTFDEQKKKSKVTLVSAKVKHNFHANSTDFIQLVWLNFGLSMYLDHHFGLRLLPSKSPSPWSLDLAIGIRWAKSPYFLT